MHLTMQLPHDVTSIARARRALDPLRPSTDDTVLSNACLLVSELVTNVVRHVDAPDDDIVLEIERDNAHLRVEVANKGGGFAPEPRAERQDLGSGWGLHILGKLAARWGVESNGETRVWFELDTAAAA